MRKHNEKAEKLENLGALQGAKVKIPRLTLVSDATTKEVAEIKQEMKITDEKAMEILNRALAEKQREMANG